MKVTTCVRLITLDDQAPNVITQWDCNRKVYVPECQEVHFAMRGGKKCLVVLPYVDNGKLVADVPNQLLIHAGTLMCWAINNDTAISYASWRVYPQPKPEDYILEPTEVVNIIEMLASLDERVTKLEEEGAGNGLPARIGEITISHTTDESYAEVTLVDEETNTYDIAMYLNYETGTLDTSEVKELVDGRIAEYEYEISTDGDLIVMMN